MDQGKLRSLMFHAGFCNEDGGWDNRPIWEQEHDNFQRFAELIVRECMAMCKTAVGNADYNTGRLHCLENIKERFGVE